DFVLPSRGGAELAESIVQDVRRSQQRVTEAKTAAGHRLLEMQTPEGYWWAPLTADTTLESDYLLLQLWLYPPENGRWLRASHPHVQKVIPSILDRQLPDGGWCIYAGGPSEVNATAR